MRLCEQCAEQAGCRLHTRVEQRGPQRACHALPPLAVVDRGVHRDPDDSMQHADRQRALQPAARVLALCLWATACQGLGSPTLAGSAQSALVPWRAMVCNQSHRTSHICHPFANMHSDASGSLPTTPLRLPCVQSSSHQSCACPSSRYSSASFVLIHMRAQPEAALRNLRDALRGACEAKVGLKSMLTIEVLAMRMPARGTPAMQHWPASH